MEIFIQSINQNLTEIIASAANDKLTPASIFIELLSNNNIVSDYFKNETDIDLLLVDLNLIQEELKNNEAIEDKTITVLNRLKDETRDRYMTELGFFLKIVNKTPFKEIYNSVFTKYLNIDHISEDLSNILPSVPNQDWEEKNETILDRYGKNLSAMAANGDISMIVGREDELHRMIGILTRQTKSNPILLGEAGVGKTALVEKLACVLHSRENIPLSLINSKIIELNMATILSAGAAPGNMENIFEEIIKTATSEDIILFIDEVHLIMNENGRIANILKPAMAREKLRLIGATTQKEFKLFEGDEAIMRRFQPIQVEEPNKIQTFKILKAKAHEAEKYHNVLIPESTLLRAISLSERYITDRYQPDKSIDLIEEAASKLRMSIEGKPEVILNLQNKIADYEIDLEISNIKNKQSAREIKKKEDLQKKIKKAQEELDGLEKIHNAQFRLVKKLIHLKDKKSSLEKDVREESFAGSFDWAIEISTDMIPEIDNKIMETEQALLDFATKYGSDLVQNVVQPQMVEAVIETRTGIPVNAQDEEDIKKYKNIEDSLKKKVHGQDKPVHQISMAIQRSKAGLADPNKPFGSFLCLGPTGVGKTYLAQKLAEFMFDTEKVMHRFDMSEYMEPHSVARLFGSPPGYVGYDEGGQLTEIVRKNPYSIILFDEIEKAHKRVFDAFLQILDSGRMTDGKGNVINFKNTIIIMTSNIGSEIIRYGLEHDHPQEVIEEALLGELNSHFRPEFLNRFDAKLIFNSLKKEDIIKIADSELKKLADSLMENKELELYWHPNIPEFITEEAYSLTDGARPIKRFINDQIINILTAKLMDSEIKNGDVIYLVEDKGELFLFPIDRNDLDKLNADEKKTKVAKKKQSAKKKQRVKKKQSSSNDGEFTLDTELGD